MAQGTVAAGSIAGYIGTIYEDALLVARDAQIMSSLVTTFDDDMSTERPRQNSEYNQGTIWASLAETTDLDTQAFHPSVISTLTPAESGAQFLLTDRRVASDPFGVQRDASLELGNVLADKVESDLLGNMASLTGGTIGSAGGTLGWAEFMNARALLRATKAPEPYHCVLHEYQWLHLAKAASIAGVTVNQGQLQDAVQSRYYVGNVLGVNIYTTVRLAAGTAVSGGMFNTQAMAMDSRRAPRMEAERNASLRATELNMTQIYGHGVWRPGFGITMLGDASAPS